MSKDKTVDVKFFAPLSKSIKGENHGKDGMIDVQIICTISDDGKDMQGHNLPQHFLDTTVFEKSGRVKYEHDKEKNPKYNIGVPQLTYGMGKRTEMVAKIFAKPGTAQYEFAKSVVDDMDNMEEWNKLNPSNPRMMGCSIEAVGFLDKETGTILKALLTDVVLTNHPVNTGTLAQFLKSFSAGHNYNPEQMTGGEAGRIQSIQKKIIQVKKMGKFNTKAEFKKALTDIGVTDEIAEQKANEWEKLNTERSTRLDKFNKSISAATAIEESITAALKKPGFEPVEINKSLKSAFTEDDKGNVNPAKVLEAQNDLNVKLFDTQFQTSTEIMKGISAISGALKDTLEFNKSILDRMDDAMDRLDLISEENNLLKTQIENFEKGAKTQQLDELKVVDENKNGDQKPGDTAAGEDPAYPVITAAFNKAIGSSDLDESVRMNLANIRTGFESTGKDWKLIPDGAKEILKSHMPTIKA